jgi:hypothetical protein
MATKKPPAVTTKRDALAACEAVARERLPAVTRGFRPGRGLVEVKKAIRKLPASFPPDELVLGLIDRLFAHEPWDTIRHDLLEPLFDALRVLKRLPHQPRPRSETARGGRDRRSAWRRHDPRRPRDPRRPARGRLLDGDGRDPRTR